MVHESRGRGAGARRRGGGGRRRPKGREEGCRVPEDATAALLTFPLAFHDPPGPALLPIYRSMSGAKFWAPMSLTGLGSRRELSWVGLPRPPEEGEGERERERVGAERHRDKLGRMANVNVSAEMECE